MDPQQRKLLQYTYKALENAGITLEQCTGSRTSVYIGAFTNDWQHLSFKDSEECGTTTALGVQPCLNANRISWFYNFKGNSVNIDTACSSSLVALDLGCKGLRNGDADMSIVGGSNLIFSPDYLHSLSMMNMLSADGQCYSFDHRGTGYGRGEGFGVLVLKRLSDALQDQDTIRAVIRNTSCNQDGNTPGITQPSSASQKALIEETYSSAGLSMVPSRYFEAHGTGTQVGDPIEVNALGSAFSETRTLEDPLWVGAVKSNIGHLEGCSGIASVIKTILVLEKGIIPPNTNFERANPKIDIEFLKIKFPVEPVGWPCKGLRRASINSFDYAGTNAHVILDDSLNYLERRGLSGHHQTVRDPPSLGISCDTATTSDQSTIPNGHSPKELLPIPKILLFSAQDEASVKRQTAVYKSHFAQLVHSQDQIEAYLENLVYTLDCRRSLLAWKSFAVIESYDDLRKLDKMVSSPQRATSEPALGFVFTGQGAQWPKMGRELAVFPVYEESLRNAELYLTELGCRWLLREELYRQDQHSKIHCSDYSQPICTAVQIALVDMLYAFGIQPAAVIGHSSGEIAAAYSFGSISARLALRIAYCRGIVSARVEKDESSRGGMISVGLSNRDVQPYIDGVASQFGFCDLTIACINSDENVTVSGHIAQIDALRVLMEDNKIFARKLLVDVAYHSPHMQLVTDSYRSMIGDIEQGETSKVKIMVSSVTGSSITAAELQSPEYWVTNMVSPVKFSDAFSHLIGERTQNLRKKLDLSHRYKLNLNLLVEVGPHPALQGPIRDVLARMRRSGSFSYTSLLRRSVSALRSSLGAVGKMKCCGCPIDLVKVCVPKSKKTKDLMVLPNLPEYQFDHSMSHWYESRLSNRFRTQAQGKLDLLGKPALDWNPLEARWRNHLRVTEMPWMEDHVINGAAIYPGVGMLVMAIEAAHQMADQSRTILAFELKDVQFVEPLNIPRDIAGRETQISLRLSRRPSGVVREWTKFRLCAYEKGEWYESCRGFVRVQYKENHGNIDGGREALEELKQCRKIEADMAKSCQEPVEKGFFYQNLSKSGFDIGPAFERIDSAAFDKEHQAKGHVEIFRWRESESPQPHVIHPTTLDAILQVSIIVLTEGGRKMMPTMVPSSVKYLKINKDGLSYPTASRIKTCAWMTTVDNRGAEFDHIALDDVESSVLAQVTGMRLTIIAGDAMDRNSDADQEKLTCYRVEHRPDFDLFGSSQQPVSSKGLIDFLDILAHKRPGLRVLEISTNSTERVSTAILDDILEKYKRGPLELSPLLHHYTSSSESTLSRMRELFESCPGVSFGLLDIMIDPEKQGLEPETYDVLVVTGSCYQYKWLKIILEHMLKLLKKGSWLVFSEKPERNNVSRGESEQSRENLTRDSLGNLSSRLPFEILQSSTDLLLLRKKSQLSESQQQTQKKPLVVVTEPGSVLQSRFAEKISAEFLTWNQDSPVQVSNLDEASVMPVKDGAIFIILLELDQPFVYSMSESRYLVLQRLLLFANDILWVRTAITNQSMKPEYAIIDGLARVMRNERGNLKFTTVVFEIQHDITDRQLQLLFQVLSKNHFSPDSHPGQDEPEYYEINGALNIPRLVRHEKLSGEVHVRSIPQRSSLKAIQNAPPLELKVESPGLLDTLHFVEDKDFAKPLAKGKVEIRTEAIGVNFKDCLVALAQVPGSKLGLECAGIVTRVGLETDFIPGNRVLMAAQGSSKTFARGRSSATCKIPENMSFVEAAAIPVQFGTAWAVVCHMARLRAGESILVHAAAGGTGQACVQIARYLGATVLATVGSLEKKRILMNDYKIAEDHIFDSRNTSFAKGVKRITNGRGVDVVINSLAGEAMVASWGCIAPYGRFVEIGKKDIMTNSNLPMSLFAKNAAFMGFDVSTLHEERPYEVRRDLEMLIDMFSKKQLHFQRPLHIRSVADVREVYRLLSSGGYAGKFVLEVLQDTQVPTIFNNATGFGLDPKSTYVIAGGLGGLGRSTARWMIRRNARNLILLSRSGVKKKNAEVFVEELKSMGARVEAPICDIANIEVLHQVFGSLVRDMPPIRGCVQASMVARDVLFQDMTFDNWQCGVNCKAIGSMNLHRILPSGMDFFILLSSASGLVGLRGQANYNGGNTFQDAFARYRASACGDKTVSLDLGAMVDDGMLAENPNALQRVLTYGVLHPITRARFYGILDYYCDSSNPILTTSECQMAIGVGYQSGKEDDLKAVDLDRYPLFRHLVYDSQSAAPAKTEDDDGYYPSVFSESNSFLEAATTVIRAVVGKLARTLPTLSQRNEDIDTNRSIQSYGVDSLLAVELRNWIKKELLTDIAVFEIQGASTFETLGRAVAERSTLEHRNWKL